MKLSLSSGLFLPSGEQGLANERKFAGDARAQPFVAALLDARLLPDRYHPEDRINSFYFDTPDLRSWAEKDNGDNLKTKIRVRWYGRPEELSGDVPVYLEAKHRVGAARRKAIGSVCAFQSSGAVGIAIGSSVIAIAAIRRGANGPSCIMPATVSARSPFSSHTAGVSSHRNPVGSLRRFGSRSSRRPISAKSNRHDSTS